MQRLDEKFRSLKFLHFCSCYILHKMRHIFRYKILGVSYNKNMNFMDYMTTFRFSLKMYSNVMKNLGLLNVLL